MRLKSAVLLNEWGYPVTPLITKYVRFYYIYLQVLQTYIWEI